MRCYKYKILSVKGGGPKATQTAIGVTTGISPALFEKSKENYLYT